MNQYALAFAVPFILMLAYRERGMAHPWGTTINRIFSWAVPNAFICVAVGMFHDYPVWYGLVSGTLAFAGCCIGHSSFQNDTRASNIKMSIYCAVLLTGILAPFIYSNPGVAWLIPFGLLGGFAYYLGYRIPWTVPGFAVPGDASWGEALTGFLAFGLPLAFLCAL